MLSLNCFFRPSFPFEDFDIFTITSIDTFSSFYLPTSSFSKLLLNLFPYLTETLTTSCWPKTIQACNWGVLIFSPSAAYIQSITKSCSSSNIPNTSHFRHYCSLWPCHYHLLSKHTQQQLILFHIQYLHCIKLVLFFFIILLLPGNLHEGRDPFYLTYHCNSSNQNTKYIVGSTKGTQNIKQ